MRLEQTSHSPPSVSELLSEVASSTVTAALAPDARLFASCNSLSGFFTRSPRPFIEPCKTVTVKRHWLSVCSNRVGPPLADLSGPSWTLPLAPFSLSASPHPTSFATPRSFFISFADVSSVVNALLLFLLKLLFRILQIRLLFARGQLLCPFIDAERFST